MKGRKLRILTVVHELPPLGGGGGRVALDLARELAKAGHEVDIVTMGFRGLPAYEEEKNLRVYRVRCVRRKAELSYTDEKVTYVLSAAWTIRKLLRERSYGVVHAHFIVPGGLAAILGAGRLPLVVTCHGSDVPGYNPDYYQREHQLIRPVWFWVVRRAIKLVAPSDFLKILLTGAGVDEEQVKRIPYGFPANRFHLSKREKKILVASRLLPRKGVQHLLRAIEGTRLNYEVHIVGDGPMRKQLEEMAARTATPVKFWGWLDNDSPQLRELYETASIYVLPSSAENFPVGLLEAMSAGLAIVTTNVRGCPEVVGEAALLVPPEDPYALRQAIGTLVSKPELIHELGDKAYRRVRDLFSWERVAPQYVALFEQVAMVTRRN